LTEPTPDPTGAELDQAISDAGKELTAALLARPRSQARLDAARTDLLRLRDIADAAA
jgi:hypothetical protein